eukprot:TRINITY_DN6113_c0_g1_i1.p1 TRINITY_DN6113_c0_g1~~TRINITY_DN6113_c0_g1_i1.p1  ORF type:complete len:536 (+),score=189.85 TRINITY_DN6113_c0_g1_i1:261-1868(+)
MSDRPEEDGGEVGFRRGRSHSFRDSDKYKRTQSGTFVRADSDAGERSHSGTMPTFRQAIHERLKKTKDDMPKGLMRDILETYKPHILSHRRRLIEDCVRDLRLNNDHIHIVEQAMRKSIQSGLQGDSSASVKCYPTYVTQLPNGAEEGRFLSLDLGGTNFRVLYLEIEDGDFLMDSKIYAIPQSIMTGSGKLLFDHIAACLADFVTDRELGGQRLPLGFTFSFPLEQISLANAKLVRWTKGFNCSDVEGQDVVGLLQEAINRRGDIKIDICAILNDTTGCLMTCASLDSRCRIGLILGTGTNACYLERVKDIALIKGSSFPAEHMLVNTEWGGFGEAGELDFILTKWDLAVDQLSVNPGAQIFEKMISGMYMGELIRQVLVDLIKDDLIFFDCNKDKILERGCFYTRFASEIESDPVGDYTRTKAVLEELEMDPETVSEEDCSALRYVCECVSRRASFMASAGIAALLKKMDYKDVLIGIDGSLFRYHPHFKNVMQSRISQLMGIDFKFDLLMAEDGSGRGAALVAAVLKREGSK